MKLSNFERETIINFNEEQNTASVFTHNRAVRNKLERLSSERPEECRLNRTYHDNQAAEFYIPKSWIRFNPPRKAAPLTDEQKRQRREQLAKMRNA